MGKIYLNLHASSKVKQCLKAKGITQEEFAQDFLQVTHRTFQNWLTGQTPISFEKLDALQSLCCISIKDLFGEVPKEYATTTKTLVQILKQFLNLEFLNSVKKHYQNYITWLVERIHFHPYPTEGYFQIIEHKTEKHGENFYGDIEIILPNRNLPIGEGFIIGFIYVVGRIRLDYGEMNIKDGYIEVKESFIRNSVKYKLPIDMEKFQQTGVIFSIATWFGEEDCTFIIRSPKIHFQVGALKKLEEKEEDIFLMKGKTKVVFQRVVWQDNK